MALEDDNMIKIMSSLGLNFSPADQAISAFQGKVASLNKQIFDLKANMAAGFSSQSGSMSGGTSVGDFAAQYAKNNVILDQHGNILKEVKTVQEEIAGFNDKAIRGSKQHGEAVQDVAKKYNILGSELQRRVSWFTTGGLFYGGINAAKEAVQSISEVEMGVTQIARVMEDSAFVFKDYRNELLQLGVDYGQTFDVVQDISLRWAQAGYNVRDSLENTKTSLLALNTAELNASQATESLIGVMAQWDLTAKDLPLLLDKINLTADNFVITSDGLIAGLLKSSETAKNFGLTLDQNIALLTTMKEASGAAGKEIGNALRSILVFTQRDKTINALDNLGISSFADAAKTQFRPAWDIFQDVAAKWPTASKAIQDGFIDSANDAGLLNEELTSLVGMGETWTDVQKRDIAEGMAGNYRRNYIISLITRLAEAQKVLNGLTDAAGYSQRENARTMETLEKKYESLKTAATELAVALGDAGLLDMLKGLTDGATSAADGFAKMDPAMKSLVVTALELVGLSAGLKGVMGLFTSKNLIFGAAAILPGWTKLLAIIPALVGAIGLFSSNANSMTEEQSKSVALLADQYDTLKSSLLQLEKGSDQYNEIQGKINETVDNIIKQNPDLIEGYDEATGAIRISETALQDIKIAYGDVSDAISEHIKNLTTMTDEQIVQDKRSLQSTIDTAKKRLQAESTLLQYYKNNPTEDSEKASNFATNAWNNLIDQLFGIPGNTLGESDLAGKWFLEMESKLKEGDKPSETAQKNMLEQSELLDKALSDLGAINSDIDTNRPWLNLPESMPEPMRSQIIANMKAAAEEEKKKGKSNGGGNTGGDGSKTNEPLQNALRLLEHKKAMNEISLEDEIKYLKKVNLLYVRNGDERMDIEERIYNTGKALQDKRLQNSIDWISQEKEYGRLSAEETIAAWNRVLAKQKDNAEAVKTANKGIFDTYKDLISEQQKDIKKAYDDRIDMIDKEAKKQKGAQDELIKGYEKKQKDLDRSETAKSYTDNIADIDKQIAYWSVRTSEEARQKVIDLQKERADEQHSYDVEQQKQSLEDQKQAAQDKKDQIDKDAEAQKIVLENMWVDIQDIFNDNNTNLIANAATTSQKVAEEYGKISTKIKETFQNAGFKQDTSGNWTLTGAFEATQGAKEVVDTAKGHDWKSSKYPLGMSDSDYKTFKANGDAWDKASATDRIKLQAANDALRRKYGRNPTLGEYPKFHTGAETLSYGMAMFKPGELVFPPTLSTDLKALISTLSGNRSSRIQGTSTDNRQTTNFNSPLLHVEKMVLEDDVDTEIFANEIARAVKKRR